MPLTADQIAAATADRFERWGRFLLEQSATPIMMVSLRASDVQPIITTCEELDDETAIELLRGMLRVLRQGRAERLARPPGATGTTDRYTMEESP